MDGNLHTERFSGLVPDSPIEVKLLPSPSGTGFIAGYASTFGGVPDYAGDIITQGAFTKSLARHSREGTSPAMLWSHIQSEVIGTWTALKEDSHGLFVEGQLNQNVARGREAFSLLQSGAIRSLSIGYTRANRRVIKGATTILDADLIEISLVAAPANTRARITNVKDIESRRGFEDLLREVGFSRSQAVALACKGWTNSEIAEQDQLQEIYTWLKNAKQEIERI